MPLSSSFHGCVHYSMCTRLLGVLLFFWSWFTKEHFSHQFESHRVSLLSFVNDSCFFSCLGQRQFCGFGENYQMFRKHFFLPHYNSYPIQFSSLPYYAYSLSLAPLLSSRFPFFPFLFSPLLSSTPFATPLSSSPLSYPPHINRQDRLYSSPINHHHISVCTVNFVLYASNPPQ